MEMTNEEILRDYKSAKHKGQQVQILAELNLCKPDDIIRILKAGGIDGRALNGLGKRHGGGRPKKNKEKTMHDVHSVEDILIEREEAAEAAKAAAVVKPAAPAPMKPVPKTEKPAAPAPTGDKQPKLPEMTDLVNRVAMELISSALGDALDMQLPEDINAQMMFMQGVDSLRMTLIRELKKG